MLRLFLFILGLITTNSSPIQSEELNKLQSENDLKWDEKVLSEVEKVIQSHSKKTDEMLNNFSEISWQVAANNDPKVERPRPPQLDASIGNLLGVVDRLTMENANAVSNHEAVTSSYLGRKAEIEGKLAVPLQQLRQRLEKRQLCDKEEKAMAKLDEIVKNGLNREREISEMREIQSSHYKDMTSTMKSLTEKNHVTLSKIKQLINFEIKNEEKIDGSVQFDPIALRQREPEDMLEHSKQLSTNLGNILEQKMLNQNKALLEISNAFSCPLCEEKAKRLREISSSVESSRNKKREECQTLAESHRALDEADREKTLALKKELQDLETAQRLREEAEKSLKEQRNKAENVAKKMVGFYQNLPEISSN